MDELVFIKFGGSLITDKTRPYAFLPERVRRLGGEVRQAQEENPHLRLVLAHGSGSFGHYAAAPYRTREGVHSPDEWRGFAEVSAAAARLNRLVTDLLLETGVPVISLQPSASARCRDGVVVHMAVDTIREVLARGLTPLIYGDVALDEVRGGTIASTEDLFVYLAQVLPARRILLLGRAPGVLDRQRQVIPRITPTSLPSIRPFLSGARGVDVTGGMAAKVARMVELVESRPDLVVHILSGLEPGMLHGVLLEPETPIGTRIVVA